MKTILVIDKPTSCVFCPVHDGEYGVCNADGIIEDDENPTKCPLKPLGRKVEEYGLETWNTRDGTFLCEKGLFDKLYGKDDE